MPFAYFGGKKGLARYYPPPAFGTIIEPFAGSAGYALHWATPQTKVVLIERDNLIIGLWRRLQSTDARDYLLAIDCPRAGARSDELLLSLTAGGSGGTFQQAIHGRDFQVTDRIVEIWARHRAALVAALPIIRDWTVIEGDYTDAPDVRATWFIDPPYWVPPNAKGSRGDGYRHGAAGINFDALSHWCRSRKGQTIVCEQEGATWLPFRPLRRMTTASGDGGRRTEVVWTRTPGSVLATPRATKTTADAAARRAARRAR